MNKSNDESPEISTFFARKLSNDLPTPPAHVEKQSVTSLSSESASSTASSQAHSPSLRGLCGRNRFNECVSLFDASGISLRPWLENGYYCYAYDLVNVDEVRDGIHYRHADLDDADTMRRIVEFHRGDAYFVSAYPPCTDMALSGSRWWAAKRAANDLFQHLAAARAIKVARAAEAMSCIYYIENPVGALCSLWRKCDFSFHPYEYGGYLPIGDVHPTHPDRVPARDAYPKRTCIWASKTFRKPPRKPIAAVFRLFKNAKTGKLNRYAPQHAISRGGQSKCAEIRSLTPRGFSKAVFLANKIN